MCFNPRPPRRTGATPAVLAHRPVDNRVSILARPVGRAQRVEGAGCKLDGRVVSILARPVGRAQLDGPVPTLVVDLDVSILARPVGRAQPESPRLWRRAATCFNPRPPRRTGATP